MSDLVKRLTTYASLSRLQRDKETYGLLESAANPAGYRVGRGVSAGADGIGRPDVDDVEHAARKGRVAAMTTQDQRVTCPTHYCKDCYARWRQNDDLSMSLRSSQCCGACNNAPVGGQLIQLSELADEEWAQLLNLSIMMRRLMYSLDEEGHQPLREQAMALLNSYNLTGSAYRIRAALAAKEG